MALIKSKPPADDRPDDHRRSGPAHRTPPPGAPRPNETGSVDARTTNRNAPQVPGLPSPRFSARAAGMKAPWPFGPHHRSRPLEPRKKKGPALGEDATGWGGPIRLSARRRRSSGRSRRSRQRTGRPAVAPAQPVRVRGTEPTAQRSAPLTLDRPASPSPKPTRRAPSADSSKTRLQPPTRGREHVRYPAVQSW